MIILRQKNYARATLSRGTFRNRLKSLYHNTGSYLNRRISRTTAMAVGHPDIAIVKGAANTIQPVAGYALVKQTGNPMWNSLGAAPTSYLYIPFSKKLASKVPIGKGRTLADLQTKLTKKTYIKTKNALDKHGINESMKNLDTTTVGKGLAKVYKTSEKTVKGVENIIKTVPETIDINSAPIGNLSRRPVLA